MSHQHTLPRLLLWMVSCCWVMLGHSQQFTVSIRQFELQDGLINRRVNAILEDRQGFIWLGMSNGLQRFDGRNFKNWSPKNGASEFFDISHMYLDNAGWIWIWNVRLKKFAFLNTLTEEVATVESRFPDGFPVAEFKRPWWYDQHQGFPTHDARGRLYWMCEAPPSLVSFDATEGFISMPLKINPQDTLLGIVLVDEQDRLWGIGLNKQSLVFQLNTQGHVLRRWELPRVDQLLPIGTKGKHLLFRMLKPEGSELAALDRETGTMQHPMTEEAPNQWFIDPFVWKLEPEGWKLEEVGKEGQIALQIPRDAWRASLVADNSIIMQDSRNRVWIINNWGMSCVEIRRNRFQVFGSVSV